MHSNQFEYANSATEGKDERPKKQKNPGGKIERGKKRKDSFAKQKIIAGAQIPENYNVVLHNRARLRPGHKSLKGLRGSNEGRER